ncbi:MAG: carboxypeptidase regulatory-like domain-containing protein [Elusimicrobia bacterium]|nr:carboxypeptidase regulatory-like domain-containing protein [Elusimicrobiota bacterium]
MRIQVTWNEFTDATSGIDHFTIARKVNEDPWGSESGPVSSPWTDTAVIERTTYTYRVTAYDGAGNPASKDASPFLLLPPTGEFRGIVSLSRRDGSTPDLGGVTVQVLQQGTEIQVASTITDGTGLYNVAVAPGTYDLKASKAEFTFHRRDRVILPERETVRRNFTLWTNFGGLVRNGVTGQGIPGATVQAVRESDGQSAGSTTTYRTPPAAVGQFDFSIAPGRYRLTARADGFFTPVTEIVTLDFPVSSPPNQIAQTFNLRPVSTLTGRVTHAWTGPIPRNARVTVTPEGGGTSQSAPADLNGYYTFLTLVPGVYLATASAPGFLTGPEPPARVDIPAGQTITQHFQLIPTTFTASGTVRLPPGQGWTLADAAGICVKAYRGDLSTPVACSTTTAAGGAYTIPFPLTSSHTWLITAPVTGQCPRHDGFSGNTDCNADFARFEPPSSIYPARSRPSAAYVFVSSPIAGWLGRSTPGVVLSTPTLQRLAGVQVELKRPVPPNGRLPERIRVFTTGADGRYPSGGQDHPNAWVDGMTCRCTTMRMMADRGISRSSSAAPRRSSPRPRPSAAFPTIPARSPPSNIPPCACAPLPVSSLGPSGIETSCSLGCLTCASVAVAPTRLTTTGRRPPPGTRPGSTSSPSRRASRAPTPSPGRRMGTRSDRVPAS